MLAAGCGGGDDAAEAPAQDQVLVALALDVDAAGLATAADGVALPSGSSAGRWLTLDDVAAGHGASRATIDAAVSALAERGVDVTADPTGGVLWGTVDVSTAESVFDVTLDAVEPAGGGAAVIEPDRTPSVPDGVEGVTAVVGLRGTAAPGEGVTGTTVPSGGPDTSSPAPPASCPDDAATRGTVATAYGLGPLVDGGATGQGATVALLETEALDPTAFDLVAACESTGLAGDRVASSVVPLAPPATDGPEAALDATVVGLVAPEAAMTVVRFDVAGSIVFPLLQVLADAEAAGATPTVVVSALGFCEGQLAAGEVAMAEWLLSALAATGTTTVAATGDVGSSACYPSSDDPAVQYPASSAWVTAVGGVQGGAGGSGDLAVWNATPGAQEGAGGGVSTAVARPSWQTGTGQDGDRRVVPDLSAPAAPGAVQQLPRCDDGACAWAELGGTSLAASGVAGGVALGAGQGPGGRLGALGPAIDAAGVAGGGPVTDVTAGDNQVFTDECCTAGPGFDLASGWGVVDLPTLFSSLGR